MMRLFTILNRYSAYTLVDTVKSLKIEVKQLKNLSVTSHKEVNLLIRLFFMNVPD